MKQLTVRNVPAELARALEEEKKRRNLSLNRTVLALLQKALGLGPKGRYDNGLGRLAGTWSDQELDEFERNAAIFEQIDEEMWR